MDPEELRRRFARVGRRNRRPERTLAPAIRGDRPLPLGDEVTTGRGTAFRIEQLFALDHEHGRWPLHAALGFDASLAADVAQRRGLAATDPRRLVFLDTETTGLAGGAGTLVFLVGIGRFVDNGFRLRQYFLRDPAEEPAMLLALEQDLQEAEGFVTFNGQRFDMPLLEMRYVAGLRRHWRLTEIPQLDLLFPARRLWRSSLPDCSLSTLEATLLGVRRSDDDVPGFEIPGIYLDFLRSGATDGISRVVYHNHQDVLSLVGLAAHVLDRHATDAAGLAEGEAVALARWHDRLGRTENAERYFEAALGSDDEWIRVEALSGYTRLLKRSGRRRQAVSGWEEWSRLAPRDPTPAIELAKYYEWELRQPTQAHRWATQALEALSDWPADWRRRSAEQAIRHRIGRLDNKVAAG